MLLLHPSLLSVCSYEIVDPPADYAATLRPAILSGVSAAAAAVLATPTPMATPFYQIPEPVHVPKTDLGPVSFTQELGELTLKPEDYQVFSKLFAADVDDEKLSHEEMQERKIAALLLKIKNGTPPVRRTALKQITEKVGTEGCVGGCSLVCSKYSCVNR